MKKFLTVGIVTLLLFASSIGSVKVFAAEPAIAPLSIATSTSIHSVKITPKAEHVKWYYRYDNGVLQHRLWSFTENNWLTPWINC